MQRPDRVTWAAVFLAVFTLVLFAANLLFTAHQVGGVRTAEAAASANAVSIARLCQAGNEQDARQTTLWDHLLTVAAARGPAGETPEQRRFRLAADRALTAYIHKVFAPRDCTTRFR